MTFMLMENIKRDNDRVDIATLLPSDTVGNEVTGAKLQSHIPFGDRDVSTNVEALEISSEF